jgi:ribosomal-protein-alanine N-acetyltransferase
MATPALANRVRLEVGTSADLDDVGEIMEEAFGTRFGEAWTRSQCAGILPMAGVSLTIARDPREGETLGFSLSRSVADEAELLLLAVLPSRHRQGIGTRLLDDFMERAQDQNAARAHLEVRDGNPAVAMYRGAGFSQVGRRRNYYQGSDGLRYDALTLARKL